MVDGRARVAEHQRVLGLVVAQHVDDGVLAVGGRDDKRPVFDVVVLSFLTRRRDAHRIALVALGKRGDGARHGRRKHQRAALGRCRVEDEFKVLAKAEVEHLVGLVQHHRLQCRHIECMAGDVVAQAAGRADDDMRAALQRAPLRAHVHAADAGGDGGAGEFVEPFQLSRDLQRQFPRRRNRQRQRRTRMGKALLACQQARRKRKTEGHRLAGAGLRRHQRVGLA